MSEIHRPIPGQTRGDAAYELELFYAIDTVRFWRDYKERKSTEYHDELERLAGWRAW